jgi:hypothetical protein
MAVSLTETIHEIGESLLEQCRAGEDIGAPLCTALESLLVSSFGIGFLGIKSPSGEALIERELIIYTRTADDAKGPVTHVTCDAVAGVIYLTPTLNKKSLTDGYSRIGRVKALPRSDRPTDHPGHNVPVGMIVACNCDRPLEELVDLIGEVNSRIPSTKWPDAFSVLKRGIINHGIQFEGGKIGGDFILPNTTGAAQFAMYVHVMVCSLDSYTFNRTCGLLFMHLGCFSGVTKLPTSQMVMEGVERVAVNTTAYMFNQADLLVPVPDRMRQDRGYGLELMPYRIESQDGKLLSRVQFVPWLEGAAAIRVYGNLPLLPFIALLGKVNVRVHEMKTADGRISSILPISRAQFELMLSRMRQQSNFVVKPEQPSWTITKMADEGTSSPFMARLFLNVLRIDSPRFEPRMRSMLLRSRINWS